MGKLGCRCTVQRLRHAGRKHGQFVMLDTSSGETVIACLNAKSRVYDLFLYNSQAGEFPSLQPGLLGLLPPDSSLHSAC